MSINPFEHMAGTLENGHKVTDEAHQVGMLPPSFQFSQNTLQDYVECARRFQLRYALGQQWPAIESEPVEEHEHFIERGSQFHLLVQRHVLGVPTESLTPTDPMLRGWWEDYLKTPPPDLPQAVRLPELGLSTPIGDQRLMARFDLLALDPGQRAVIVDWKTTRRKPDRATLGRRMQTRIYPFVLVEAGSEIFGTMIKPEQVSLVYWFAAQPDRPETFTYSTEQHEETRGFLSQMIGEAVRRDEETWPLTDDEKLCGYCVYRSLCNRGVEAGGFEELDGEIDAALEIDLGSVDEIAF